MAKPHVALGRAGRCTCMVKPPGFFFPHSPFKQVRLYGEATDKNWGAVLLYSLCGMTQTEKPVSQDNTKQNRSAEKHEPKHRHAAVFFLLG